VLCREKWESLALRLGVVIMLCRLARLIWVLDITLFCTLPPCNLTASVGSRLMAH